MAEYIKQQIESGKKRICDSCFHRNVCKGIGNKPCMKCNHYQDAADVAPVRRGRWEGYSHSRYCGVDDFGDPIYKDGVVYYCSECRRKTVIKERYCPACGAKMDGDTDA